MRKPADTLTPINPLLTERWSPRAFDPTPLSAEDVAGVLEAARWAPSSMNEQPWSFIVATIDDAQQHAALVATLMPMNQVWAKSAPLLVITVAHERFTRNGDQNRHAWHDLGLATSMMMVEATARGLFSHAMGGIFPDQIRETYGVPEGFSPVAALAIGRAGDPDSLPEPYRAREATPRVRKDPSSFVFTGAWGKARG